MGEWGIRNLLLSHSPILPFVFAVLLCLLLAAGCGRQKAGKGVTEIVYLTRATPDQLEVWRRATKEFMRLNPDVRVRFENLPYAQYWDKFQTMTAAGVAPDVIFMESGRFPKFADSGSLENLEPYIERDGDLELDDLSPRPRFIPLEGRHLRPAERHRDRRRLLQQGPLRRGGRPVPEAGMDLGRLPPGGEGAHLRLR